MSELDGRPVLAALANPVAREMYARVVLGTMPVAPVRREERALEQLHSAGLITDRDGVWTADDAHLRELLHRGARRRPKDGPERFLTPDGRIDRYPTQQTERTEFLRFLVPRVIGLDEALTEPELNARLAPLTADTALLRRMLVDQGILNRDAAGSRYRLIAV